MVVVGRCVACVYSLFVLQFLLGAFSLYVSWTFLPVRLSLLKPRFLVLRIMACPDLKSFQELATLSSLAMDAVIRWDDVTDKFDDNPGLLTVLEISQAEVDEVSNFCAK